MDVSWLCLDRVCVLMAADAAAGIIALHGGHFYYLVLIANVFLLVAIWYMPCIVKLSCCLFCGIFPLCCCCLGTYTSVASLLSCKQPIHSPNYFPVIDA